MLGSIRYIFVFIDNYRLRKLINKLIVLICHGYNFWCNNQEIPVCKHIFLTNQNVKVLSFFYCLKLTHNHQEFQPKDVEIAL